MYVFQSESTLYSCLDVKELVAWNKHDIWSLSDRNGTQIHNHLAEPTKWLSARLLVRTFLIHNSRTKIFQDKRFLQNISQE